MNGLWGTIAVGFFATETAPGFAVAGIQEGLFYGGGLSQLFKQLGGMAIIILWTVVTITLTFYILKNTIGLRVTEEEEILGLDATEHGLDSAYAGFYISDMTTSAMMENANTNIGNEAYEEASELKKNAAVSVIRETSSAPTGIYKVTIVAKSSRFDELKKALNELGVTGMTVTQVMGCGIQKGSGKRYRGVEMDVNILPKTKIDVVVGNIPVDQVIEAARKALYTGHIGDGKIFVYDVENVVKVRTGEEGYDALQDVE